MHRAKMFLPVCSHLDSYKRLHLLRYSIHILSLLPLSRPLLPLLPPLIPPVLAQHQCQYFVVRCIVAYYLSLPLPPILYCIILPRGNCSEFQPFVTRGEGGNNKCGYLDASTRFHVQIRETRRLPIKMSLGPRFALRRGQTPCGNFIIRQINRRRRFTPRFGEGKRAVTRLVNRVSFEFLRGGGESVVYIDISNARNFRRTRLLMTLFEGDSCQGCWQYFTIERNSND